MEKEERETSKQAETSHCHSFLVCNHTGGGDGENFIVFVRFEKPTVGRRYFVCLRLCAWSLFRLLRLLLSTGERCPPGVFLFLTYFELLRVIYNC